MRTLRLAVGRPAVCPKAGGGVCLMPPRHAVLALAGRQASRSAGPVRARSAPAPRTRTQPPARRRQEEGNDNVNDDDDLLNDSDDDDDDGWLGEDNEQERLAGPSGRGDDGFDSMHARVSALLEVQRVPIRRESMDKLFGRISSPRHARRALELLLADARVRDAVGWDWATHGYGQSVGLLVASAAAAGAPELAEELLSGDTLAALHLGLSKDLLPTLIRKLAAVEGVALGPLLRLYVAEARLRGGNSPEAAYELSRALRRAEDVRGVQALYGQIRREKLAVRDRLLDDLERWLGKRGVRI